MKLGQLLFITGMVRDSYNTLQRRGHLPFMEREIEGRTDHDRYDASHALALASFKRLCSIGLATAAAGEAVNDSFRDMRRLTGLSEAEPLSHRCGVLMTEKGVIRTFGHPGSDTEIACIIGQSSIDLDAMWTDVQAAIGELQ